ncbi:MAG: S-methyl-5'-thioadenosine phosphorylase [Candidatus Nitronauta litoralis]|uniref:Purine nucleoside phosphorylase n=1 Tax=Candidatus Nitronauta litoralis TaxID=2705533 RepID=A0A7T0BYE5_9BACT|nr:MAG: S-methyl-5'-thioadenosine phosphorylase [Candidatus Nitronauta litoralis]
MAAPVLGVIGGSGLYSMKDLEVLEEVTVDTPFGAPSDALIRGNLMGREMLFLPRHGVGHRIPPSEINYRANIFAMKKLGVKRILSVSAVGSMKEEIVPGHIVLPDQFIDRTHRRISTFFTDGIVGHVALADPICSDLQGKVAEAAQAAGATLHVGGTYICIEGPQFSTKAESMLYRSWGVDVIGMTNVTEAKLAREAGLCYVTMALSTDYDCWHNDHDSVTLEAILEIMHQNVALAQGIVKETAAGNVEETKCDCANAAASAVVTDRSRIPENLKKDLKVLFGSL